MKKKLSFVAILFISSLFVKAQSPEDYLIKKDSWEETVRASCDKLNYDWNHKEGRFNFIFYYKNIPIIYKALFISLQNQK